MKAGPPKTYSRRHICPSPGLMGLMVDDINDFINASDIHVEKRGEKSTLVEIEFPTGWKDYEVSSCVDPANYDEELGKHRAEAYRYDRISRRKAL